MQCVPHGNTRPYARLYLFLKILSQMQEKVKMQIDTIIISDNLTALRDIDTDSVDLVHRDPPFNTERDFADGKGGYTDKHAAEKAEGLAFERREFQWLNAVLYLSQKTDSLAP